MSHVSIPIGAVKSGKVVRQDGIVANVSIPIGAVKRKEFPVSAYGVAKFQFQSVRLKAILKYPSSRAMTVSIPIGAVKSRHRCPGIRRQFEFQFQSVRLKV